MKVYECTFRMGMYEHNTKSILVVASSFGEAEDMATEYMKNKYQYGDQRLSDISEDKRVVVTNN